MPDTGYWWNQSSISSSDRPSTAIGSTLGNFWNELSGTTANNQFNAEQAQLSREFSSAEAAKDRDWQKMMSDTAIQRQVADAQRAGINPMALAGSSMGASVGSGAMPHSAAASSSGSGSGGFAGLVGKVAAAAIAGALGSKMRNSANKAASSGGSVVQAVDNVLANEPKLSARQAGDIKWRYESPNVRDPLRTKFQGQFRAYHRRPF